MSLGREKKASDIYVMRLVVACLVYLLAGCGAGRPAAAPSESARSAMSEHATPGEAQLRWYLAAIAGKEAIDDAALQQHFTSHFLSQIPPDKFRAFTESIRSATHGLDLVRLEATGVNERVHAITRSQAGAIFHVLLEVEAQPPHRIALVAVKPEEEPAKAPAVHSWGDAERELRALAPRVSLLAADLDAGRCEAIHALGANESLAVGSAYKLFVLGALGREVEKGTRSWSDPLPSGKLATFSSAAESMIGKSDNNAADDLVIALGREMIERFAHDSGAADPRLFPLLLTRETFGLKYATSADEKNRFAQGNRDQRLMLAKEASTRKWSPPASPSAVEMVGWFASLHALCGATFALHELAERPQTALVGRILAGNPGLPDPSHAFSYVGYKGGSEPGLYNVNFLLKRASDGKWLYLGATMNDEHQLIDERKVVATIGAIRAFLADAATIPSS